MLDGGDVERGLPEFEVNPRGPGNMALAGFAAEMC